MLIVFHELIVLNYKHYQSIKCILLGYWASITTKNPAYSDVYYVENVIGAQTINTAPKLILVAFGDHGKVGATLIQDTEHVRVVLTTIQQLGIDLDALAI